MCAAPGRVDHEVVREYCCVCYLHPWLCKVGDPSGLPVNQHKNTALFCGFGLAGTPLHIPLPGCGGMERSIRVDNEVLQPLCFQEEGPSVVLRSPFVAEGAYPRHSWLGHLAVAVICALGLAGWVAQCASLCPTCPTCGRSVSYKVAVRRGVATNPYVWPAIPQNQVRLCAVGWVRL